MTTITVYIPTHNYGKFLPQAIESVLKQSFHEWELIVIDDGSTDNTKEFLKPYRSHPKIRIVEQDNRGLNITNNIAVRLAQGKYVMRLDADDYLDENILMILSSILDTKPEVSLVYPDYYVVDETREVIEIIRRDKIGEEDEILDLPAHGACTMIRKECLLDVGGYSEEFDCQDGYDVWLKLTTRYAAYNVNLPLFYYRQHGENMTKQQSKILNTRARIKKKFLESNVDKIIPKVFGLVPAIGRSVYPQSDPFFEFGGKPLIWYTLNELQKTATLDRIGVSSDDKRVLSYAENFPGIISLARSESLAKSTARINDVNQEVLLQLKEEKGYEPEAICVLDINTPLRRADHIDRAVHTLAIFEVDSVISVEEELGEFFQHRRHGLMPISKIDQKVRLEREGLYKANSAICITRIEVIRSGRILGDRIGHIVMLPEESVKTHSEYEFWLAEQILKERSTSK